MNDEVKTGQAKTTVKIDSDGQIVGGDGSSHQAHCIYELPKDTDGTGVKCELSPPDQKNCRKARTDRNFQF